MHYGDAFHCQNNVLILSIRIHPIMGSDDVEMDVTSILQAKFCDPMELRKILKHPRRYFMRYPEIRGLNTDGWYILKLVGTESGEYLITQIEEITDQTPEEWKKLH